MTHVGLEEILHFVQNDNTCYQRPDCNLYCNFTSLSPFVNAKVRQKFAPNQIFEPRIFPRGGDNILIFNMLKNLFLLIFHSADNQRVTAMKNRSHGNDSQHTVYQRVKDKHSLHQSRRALHSV